MDNKDNLVGTGQNQNVDQPELLDVRIINLAMLQGLIQSSSRDMSQQNDHKLKSDLSKKRHLDDQNTQTRKRIKKSNKTNDRIPTQADDTITNEKDIARNDCSLSGVLRFQLVFHNRSLDDVSLIDSTTIGTGVSIALYLFEDAAITDYDKESPLLVMRKTKLNSYNSIMELQTRQVVDLQATLHISPALEFSMIISYTVLDAFFEPTMITGKQYIVDTLLPASEAEVTENEFSVDLFYKLVDRAPPTINGLPTDANKVIEEEEIVKRRMKKGKGRADSRNTSPSDGLIEPPGLTARLMPFQSRTVRWLLAIEGKYIPATKTKKNYVQDLPEEAGNVIKRGPLWEYLPSQKMWLNRVYSQVLKKDPVLWWEDLQILRASAPPATLKQKEKTIEIADEFQYQYTSIFPISGGLLADEMGLGKTICMISLILLHTDKERNMKPAYYDAQLKTMVLPSGLTLIVTPESIQSQWIQELQKHAPELRVFEYKGVRFLKDDMTPDFINSKYDVMLTTFNVLRYEMRLAQEPHERTLKKAEMCLTNDEGEAVLSTNYKRSLFIMFDFHRLIVDEAQMVGAWNAAANTTSMIKRVYSFSVTGTPIKSVIDMQSIMRILKVEPLGSSRTLMRQLLQPINHPTFERICKSLVSRTVKNQVKHEVDLPVQYRFMVPVEFTQVEQYWYDERYASILDDLRLELDTTDVALMRTKTKLLNTSLHTLRQACCHPQLGSQNKNKNTGLKGGGKKGFRTIDQVLAGMLDTTNAGIVSSRRAYWAAKTRHAQLKMFDEEECERFEKALGVFLEAVQAVQEVVDGLSNEIQDIYRARDEKMALEDVEKSLLVSEQDNKMNIKEDAEVIKQEEGDGDLSHKEDVDLKDLLIPTVEEQTEDGTEQETQLLVLRARLREHLILLHGCKFLAGGAYYNIGKFSVEEAKMYTDAEALRGIILHPSYTDVQRAIRGLNEKLVDFKKSRREIVINRDVILPQKSGSLSIGKQLIKDIKETINTINGLSEIIEEWHAHTIGLVVSEVSISGDEATGEEYGAQAQVQEELEEYIDALTALINDWRYYIGDESIAKEKVTYFNPNAKRKNLKKTVKNKRVDISGLVEPCAEQGATSRQILRYHLLIKRAAAQPKRKFNVRKVIEAEGSKKKTVTTRKNKRKKGEEDVIRASEVEEDVYEDDGLEDEERDEDPNAIPLRQLQARLKMLVNRNSETLPSGDKKILNKLISDLRINDKLEKIGLKLSRDCVEISRVFNARISYYAQLQVISDAVQDPDMKSPVWRGLLEEMDTLESQAVSAEADLKTFETRKRYLVTLEENKEVTNDEGPTCVICFSPYKTGVITRCGHMFCHTCFYSWNKQSKTCGYCKEVLGQNGWTRTVPQSAVPRESKDETPKVNRVEHKVSTYENSALSMIPQKKLAEIISIPTISPLSTKSDIIVKHVKYIRRNDPVAKIVLFSAWREALQMITEAFSLNGIDFVRLEGKKSVRVDQFLNDPNIAVLILHTTSQSAGLNLVEARYVLLVEPLLHPGLELQALGRVHRIGQMQDTYCYQYFVKDSVDERVALNRVRNGSSLFIKDMSSRALVGTISDTQLQDERLDFVASEESIEDVELVMNCLIGRD